jgi:hypothetical protein
MMSSSSSPLVLATRVLEVKRWISGRICGWVGIDTFVGAFPDVEGAAVTVDRVARRGFPADGPVMAVSLEGLLFSSW